MATSHDQEVVDQQTQTSFLGQALVIGDEQLVPEYMEMQESLQRVTIKEYVDALDVYDFLAEHSIRALGRSKSDEFSISELDREVFGKELEVFAERNEGNTLIQKITQISPDGDREIQTDLILDPRFLLHYLGIGSRIEIKEIEEMDAGFEGIIYHDIRNMHTSVQGELQLWMGGIPAELDSWETIRDGINREKVFLGIVQQSVEESGHLNDIGLEELKSTFGYGSVVEEVLMGRPKLSFRTLEEFMSIRTLVHNSGKAMVDEMMRNKDTDYEGIIQIEVESFKGKRLFRVVDNASSGQWEETLSDLVYKEYRLAQTFKEDVGRHAGLTMVAKRAGQRKDIFKLEENPDGTKEVVVSFPAVEPAA